MVKQFIQTHTHTGQCKTFLGYSVNGYKLQGFRLKAFIELFIRSRFEIP